MIFWKIGVPIGKPGIVSAMVLGVLETWNAIEQPMTFLKEQRLWPLSLYLPEITADKGGGGLGRFGDGHDPAGQPVCDGTGGPGAGDCGLGNQGMSGERR